MPRGVHIDVHEGQRVRAGEQLMGGRSNPHDILRVLGEKEGESPRLCSSSCVRAAREFCVL